MTAAYIAGYVRTPFTFARKGALAGVRPDELGAHPVRELLKRTGAKPDDIEDVVWGCAFPEGEQELNIGRVAGLLAGLPETSAGAPINRWCGSSIQAVQVAAGMLAMNAGDVFAPLALAATLAHARFFLTRRHVRRQRKPTSPCRGCQ